MNFEQLESKLFDNRPLPTRGSFLLANPFLADPHFRKTVILLVEHNDDGSLGFVINKPMEVQLDEATDGTLNVHLPVHYGGPVQADTLFYVHRLANGLDSCMEVVDNVFWGGSYEELTLRIGLQHLTEDDIRFVVGYSGWSAGQLQEEWNSRSWLVFPAEAEEIFAHDIDGLYSRLLRKLGVAGSLFANIPEDPRLN
jgi:putative transcriptional regulator